VSTAHATYAALSWALSAWAAFYALCGLLALFTKVPAGGWLWAGRTGAVIGILVGLVALSIHADYIWRIP